MRIPAIEERWPQNLEMNGTALNNNPWQTESTFAKIPCFNSIELFTQYKQWRSISIALDILRRYHVFASTI